MAEQTAPKAPRRRLKISVSGPAIGVLAVVWALAIIINVADRRNILKQARSQLSMAVSILADLNEASGVLTGTTQQTLEKEQATEIAQVIARYPTAKLWIEKGRNSAEAPTPRSMPARYIAVTENRATFSVHATVPQSDALAGWRHETGFTGALLLAASLALFLLPRFSTGARDPKELEVVNTIIQNSAAILYRVGVEPSLTLLYISPNLAKFGHDPGTLLASSEWLELLMDSDDRAQFESAMREVSQKGEAGGAIEFRFRNGDGTYRWAETRYTPVRDNRGHTLEIDGIIIDITARKRIEEKLSALTRTDDLTGLANRAAFGERLHQSFAASKRGADGFAVLCIDIDHFKHINDTYGHPTGDLVLREFGGRLRANTRASDLASRLGGDEFAILQSNLGDPAHAGELAEKLLAALNAPYHLNGEDIHLTASIGIAPFLRNSTEPSAILNQADLALYRAKERGRNQFRFHSEELGGQMRERIAVATFL